jgi:hypothetical protein
VSVAIEEVRVADRPVGLGDIADRERPLVIRGLAGNWPLVKLAGQSDTAFAKGLAALDNGTEVDALLMPPEAEGIIGYNADFDAFNFAHQRISVTQGLQRLAHYSRQENPPGLAMQSALISASLPGLLDDHWIAFLDPQIQPRIWIGNKVTTPAHFDEFHNIAVVVCGGRRFTLFPPEQARNLYIGPLDFAPTGAAIGTARLDRPDDPRYPRLKLALAHAQTAELHPGDAIYVPPMWWHHVESLERVNALVNYWWKLVPADGHVPETALGSLMHAILAFRSLPPAEKVAWKVLLDYYVFDDENPAEHLPEARRGILGKLTPEAAAALRDKIKRYL